MIIALFLIIPTILVVFALKDIIKRSFSRYLDGTSSKFVLIFLLLLGVVLLFIPLMITNFSIIPLTYTNAGEIGDIIGGSTAPFIGFIGIIVTFYAFWVQYQSNINQRNDIRIERFENQYYEMLRFHKENVAEMEIDNKIMGRKCFVRMFYEFKYIYLCCYVLSNNHKVQLNRDYTKDELCDLAYKIFFNGRNSISPTALNPSDQNNAPLLNLVYNYLSQAENMWIKKPKEQNSIIQTVYNQGSKTLFEFEMFYYPFDGHTTRLGHYYRHLFQTVSFIADSDIIPLRLDKYKYLKLLRAQLSNHEQLLLYYNGLVSFGEEWIVRGYFTDYRMIKNIPFDSANFGVTPVEKLGTKNKFGENLFEWNE